MAAPIPRPPPHAREVSPCAAPVLPRRPWVRGPAPTQASARAPGAAHPSTAASIPLLRTPGQARETARRGTDRPTRALPPTPRCAHRTTSRARRARSAATVSASGASAAFSPARRLAARPASPRARASSAPTTTIAAARSSAARARAASAATRSGSCATATTPGAAAASAQGLPAAERRKSAAGLRRTTQTIARRPATCHPHGVHSVDDGPTQARWSRRVRSGWDAAHPSPSRVKSGCPRRDSGPTGGVGRSS
jgi:hypothetical protein